MATIITVSNQKGGVGKTTTSAALIAGLTLAGKRVLGVDFDSNIRYLKEKLYGE